MFLEQVPVSREQCHGVLSLEIVTDAKTSKKHSSRAVCAVQSGDQQNLDHVAFVLLLRSLC